MAWTTPVTVAPGDAILASLWNEQVRDNSAYLKAEADAFGFQVITPSSVTVGSGSGSIDGNGRVLFSGASSVQIEGCFSSDYFVYRLMGVVASSGLDIPLQARMVSVTTPATGANYNWQRILARDTSVTGSRNDGQTSLTLARASSTGPNGYSVDFYYPFDSSNQTYFTSISSDTSGGSGLAVHAGRHTLTSSYDGIYLFPNSGTINGTVFIYGANK